MKQLGGGRIPFFDTAKGIFMFFVILSHSGYVPTWLNAIYGPFFLSGFFFTSGYFFLKMKDGKFDYKQKAMNILTTILCAYLLYRVLSYSVLHIAHKDFLFAGRLYQDILQGRNIWFASCIVVSELLALLYYMIIGVKKWAVYAFPIVNLAVYLLIPTGDYPWFCNVAFLANFYLGLGMIAKRHSDKFLVLITSKKWNIAVSALFLVLYGIDLIYLHQRIGFNSWYSHLWFFIPESVVAFIAVFCLSSKLQASRILKFIGVNSLLYYFFQHQVLARVTMPLGARLHIPTPYAVYAIISALIVVAILWPVIWCVNRYIPVLGGKWRVKVTG